MISVLKMLVLDTVPLVTWNSCRWVKLSFLKVVQLVELHEDEQLVICMNNCTIQDHSYRMPKDNLNESRCNVGKL